MKGGLVGRELIVFWSGGDRVEKRWCFHQMF